VGKICREIALTTLDGGLASLPNLIASPAHRSIRLREYPASAWSLGNDPYRHPMVDGLHLL